MDVELSITSSFLKDLKKLKKKYRSVPEDFEKFKKTACQRSKYGYYAEE